jgi:FlaA1/EpsC-like NDP-sugar epimerase
VNTMKWTKEQLKAIEIRGKNILVSAAAGSFGSYANCNLQQRSGIRNAGKDSKCHIKSIG